MSLPNLDAKSISGAGKGLVKGMALIDIVATMLKPLRQSQLIQASGLPHATAVRLLDVLCELDLLRVHDAGYLLGPRVAAWGQAFLNSLDFVAQARDLIDALVDRSGETCFVGVIDRDEILYVAAAHSPQAVRPAAQVGSRNPLHSTGIGKVLLAFASPETQDELLAAERHKKTPNTIVQTGPLLEELARVRARGYAIDEIENEEGIRCIAAPVRDHHGLTIAAISVSAPAYRFSTQKVLTLAPHVLHAADELSRRIGYAGAPGLPNEHIPDSLDRETKQPVTANERTDRDAEQ